MRDFPPFILASRSPRRRELLERAGYEFRVVRPPLSEPQNLPQASPAQLAEALAYFKARSVQACHPEQIVVGADTVVALDGRVYGKAADAAHARRLLERLSGTRHAVTTGLAILIPSAAGERLLGSETTYVTMRRLGPEELDAYLRSGQWRDKAGAYGIQETADRFVEKVEGSFTNVVGMPMELLERMLSQVRRRLGCRKE